MGKSHYKWPFSIAFCMFTRWYPFHPHPQPNLQHFNLRVLQRQAGGTAIATSAETWRSPLFFLLWMVAKSCTLDGWNPIIIGLV